MIFIGGYTQKQKENVDIAAGSVYINFGPFLNPYKVGKDFSIYKGVERYWSPWHSSVMIFWKAPYHIHIQIHRWIEVCLQSRLSALKSLKALEFTYNGYS